MSLIDSKLEFSDKQDLTGASASKAIVSTNVLDLGLEENHLSGNIHGAGYLNVQFVGEPVEPASAGFTITLKHSDTEAGNFEKVASYEISSANTEHKLVALLPRELKRFVCIEYTPDTKIDTRDWYDILDERIESRFQAWNM